MSVLVLCMGCKKNRENMEIPSDLTIENDHGSVQCVIEFDPVVFY